MGKRYVCPKCGKSTVEYHDAYVKHVQDVPILRKNIQLHIKAHEYKCTNIDCNASTIAESLNGFLNAQRHAAPSLCCCLAGGDEYRP